MLIESHRMARPLPLLLLLACCMPASAEQRWIKVTSSNFELFTPAGERRARDAVLYFEQVRSFFLKATGGKASAKGRVRIIAFDSEKAFRPYRLNEGVTAHAGGGRDRDEIVMRSISQEDYPVAVHEYAHILLKPYRKLPVWLNEGLAEVYSTLRPIGRNIRVGEIPAGRMTALHQAPKLLELDKLFAVDRESSWYNQKDKMPLFYAESWALVHMLFLGDKYHAKFRDFLQEIAAENPEADALPRAFGTPLAEIWKDLLEYTRRVAYNAGLFPVTLEKSAETPEVRPATAFETGLALAGILADIGKKDEARQAYTKLAQENPDRPEVPEALGYMAWSSEDLEQTRAQFAKAVELGSTNPRLYYEYAGLAEDGGAGGRARQIDLLSKAVQLDPEFRDARLQLAYGLMADQDWKGALAHFDRVRNIEPKDAFQFFYAVAYANYGLGNKEEARRNAERAARYAQEPRDRRAIDDLLEALRDRPAQKTEPADEPAAAPRVERRDKQIEVPRIERRDKPAEPPQPPPTLKRRDVSTAAGMIENLDCRGNGARVSLRVEGKLLKFLMDDPDKIEIRGAGSATYTFDCGVQKQRLVMVEYTPSVDAALGTIGTVRAIEFK